MRTWVIALVLVVAAGCGDKKKAGSGEYDKGSPQRAFVEMQRAFRAADVDRLWDQLFSAEMKEAMAMKLQAFIDRPADVVQEETGKTPDELRALGGKEIYRTLLEGDAMKEKLARGMPEVKRAVQVQPGIVNVEYTEPGGASCAQPFIKEEGAWKVKAGPVCN
jgi:hypothetical protein